ncbi:MAG: sulfite exporter TauE/SafE family protein [Akkermansiaceae bacterium]|nr:sulfite exporter TauE/SafE family protein [Akkermansiaceae bacterium]
MIDGWDDWTLAFLAAFCIGLAKSGFSGTSLVSVVIFTHLFGARQQSGMALPLLIFADVLAYPAFRNHGSWRDVWRLLPAALVGLGMGWWLLGNIDDLLARRIIGGSILLLLALQSLRLVRPGVLEKMAAHRAFGTGAGVAAGVTTTLANAAGPVFQLYLLSKQVPKMELVGIGARFFLLINLIKLPLIGHLELIRLDTLAVNLWLAPAIVAGIYCGRGLLQKVPEKWFAWLVMGFSAVAAVRMLTV